MNIYNDKESFAYNSKKAKKIRASNGKHIPCKEESKFIRQLCIKYSKTKEELFSDKNHRREIANYMNNLEKNKKSDGKKHRSRIKQRVKDKINSIAKEMNLPFMNPVVLKSAMEYYRKYTVDSRGLYRINYALLIVKDYYKRTQK